MSVPDRKSHVEDHVWLAVTKTLTSIGLLVVVIALAFVVCFLIPKLDANWKNIGVRPPMAQQALISLSRLLVRRWFVVVLLGFVCGLKILRYPRPQNDIRRF